MEMDELVVAHSRDESGTGEEVCARKPGDPVWMSAVLQAMVPH